MLQIIVALELQSVNAKQLKPVILSFIEAELKTNLSFKSVISVLLSATYSATDRELAAISDWILSFCETISSFITNQEEKIDPFKHVDDELHCIIWEQTLAALIQITDL